MAFTETVPILVQNNAELIPYSEQIRQQSMRFEAKLHEIEAWSGGLNTFSQAYNFLGINYDSQNKGWYMREWAPNAWSLYLTGDFNFWNRTELPFTLIANGIWEIFLPEDIWAERFKRNEKFKITVNARNGSHDRIPAFAQYVLQDENTKDFSACLYWQPKYAFQHSSPVK
ncbi:MAG: 1,4-alpha-glucan-branching enzyme, partial [Chitinophagia bacterium]|nr:1,4-alpha-glucan-branching enzyme [Chitinophagia bacterium]